jgi:16S rRNA (uracil1498-N3)-methyltransferase
LRAVRGQQIELFDGSGAVAIGQIIQVGTDGVTVRIEQIGVAPTRRIHLTVASALPKGARADWMIEKLCEVGVDVFIPLISRRSIVVPGGTEKHERWMRLAEQAARQAGRSDVMRIEPPIELATLVAETAGGMVEQIWYLCPADSSAFLQRAGSLPGVLMLMIGPEGGWTEQEKNALDAAGALGVKLTKTVLRVETAAIIAAGLVQSALTAAHPPATIQQRPQQRPQQRQEKTP